MNVASILPEIVFAAPGDPLSDFRAYIEQNGLKVDTVCRLTPVGNARPAGEAALIRCTLPTHSDGHKTSLGVFLRVFDDGSFTPLLQINDRNAGMLQGVAVMLGFYTDDMKKEIAKQAA